MVAKEVLEASIEITPEGLKTSATNKAHMFLMVEATVLLHDLILSEFPEVYKRFLGVDLSLLDGVVDSFYREIKTKKQEPYLVPEGLEFLYTTKTFLDTPIEDGIYFTFRSKEEVEMMQVFFSIVARAYKDLLHELYEEDIQSGKVNDEYIASVKQVSIKTFLEKTNLELKKDIYNFIYSMVTQSYHVE